MWGRSLPQVHGHCGKRHAPVASGDGAPDLLRRRLQGRQGHEALGDEARAGRGPLLHQPVVVGADAGQLQFRVLNPAEGLAGQAGHGGVEDGAVHLVHVHGLEALFGDVGGGGHVFPSPGLADGVGDQRAHGGEAEHLQGLAVDHPSLRPVVEGLDVGDAVAPPALGHA